MLVEDEDEVRSLYEDLLLSMNHQVTSVCDAMQALALLEVNEYDLIITDFCMPGMTGVELARKVKDVDPDLPIVLVSGWTMETKKTEIQDAGIDYVVHKPCTLEVLQQAIQTALSCSESKSRVGSI